MSDYLLKSRYILPPLLEQQLSPSYRITTRYLDYLQKWRKYLLWLCGSDLNSEEENKKAQQSVDECISTIMLMGIVRQSDTTSIPTLEEILKMVNKPSAFNICEAVYNCVSCKLLKEVFNPEHLCGQDTNLQQNADLSSLSDITETAKSVYGARVPITIIGDFHQLCLSRPIANKTIRQKYSGRHAGGVYYTPAPIVD